MRRSHQSRRVALIALLLLMPLSALGQDAPSESSKPGDTPNRGAISGRVVNELGEPLANARVYVRASDAPSGFSTSTNREGKFTVSAVESVSYQISASLPAYTSLARDPDSPQPNDYRVGDSVTLVLTKGGVITGTVTNEAGEPLVRVPVRAQMVRAPNGQRIRASGFVSERLTDDRGIYRLYGLSIGTYIVWAGGSANWYPSSGKYDNDIPTYSVSSSRDTAAEIIVRTGTETGNVDIHYRGERGRIVSGTVTGVQGGADVRGFSVTLNAAGNEPQWIVQADRSTGAFVFSGIEDGDYDVTARSYISREQMAISTPKRISVSGADVGGIELTTQPLATVAGRLVLEESKAPECTDKPRPLFTETLVSAWHNDNAGSKALPSYIWALGPPVPADDTGNFLLRNLAPGEYYFAARFSARHWYLRSISLASPATAAAKTVTKPIDATRVWTRIKPADKLSGLTITLAQGAASVRGQLVLNEGESQPAPVFVYLAPLERESAEDPLRFFAAPVSEEGKFALNNVAPGRYWILAQAIPEDGPSSLTKLRLPHETDTRARLRRDGEATKTEIELKPCQSLIDFKLSLKAPTP